MSYNHREYVLKIFIFLITVILVSTSAVQAMLDIDSGIDFVNKKVDIDPYYCSFSDAAEHNYRFSQHQAF